MSAPRPRGKRALFSQAPDPVPDDDAVAPTAGRPASTGRATGSGREQMFSPGTTGSAWTVECRSCRAETPVTGADLARRLLRPGSLWWPLARFPNRMPCPACGVTTWCQVHRRRPHRSP